MRGVVRRLLVMGILLALPAGAAAQEAAIAGVVEDSTGAVLPGVTVTAVHETTGNTFVAVTDGSGRFRLPARVGAYELTVELQGFTTVSRTGINLLVGQTATVNVQMAPSTIQETVTVTAEAPLLNVSTSTLGGNIDPNQMSELPVQGRDWTALALLAPGNRSTSFGGEPAQESRQDNPEYQTNIDGQQVTSLMGPGGQPRYSRDSIAEFQFISNRFDATQGRSAGVQVNAITRSGTNALDGSFAGYFRDSRWNAEDPVLGVVVPGSEQQYSGTLGGPILRDRFHFFGNYEYNRLPRSTIGNSAWPSFNISLEGQQTAKMAGLRLDYQLSPQNRLMVKGNLTRFQTPFGNIGSNHPASVGSSRNTTSNVILQFTQVLGNRALNEAKVGYAGYFFEDLNLTTWSNHPQAFRGITNGHPRIQLRGLNITGNNNWPRYWTQDVISFRDDFTTSYDARGRHDLKIGGEYLHTTILSANCTSCMGRIDARDGPIPANVEELFPVWNNADTWNIDALSPLTRRFIIGISEDFPVTLTNPKYAFWVQDDWHISDRLTLNLGLRYDLIWNSTNQETVFEPLMEPDRPQDADNFQPRLGFAYQFDDRTVLRGGVGKYYVDIIAGNFTHSKRILDTMFLEEQNDGRPDFASNPFNGPMPTYQQALQRVCDVNPSPNCLRRGAEELAPPPGLANLTSSWQTSIGVQRQVANAAAVEVDYVYRRDIDQKVIHGNANVTFDPATGANLPFGDIDSRPLPQWGTLGFYGYHGWANYHALQTTLTKRLSDNWQASANYTLSGYWTGDPPPLTLMGGSLGEVPFPVAADLGGDYSLGSTDQRHRMVFNGIWQVGGGFQVSGLYFFGSGERMGVSAGDDFRELGGGSERLREDGTIVPREGIVGDPIHRVDVRFQQRVPLGGRAQIDGILEVFNLFDRANYGSYVTDESNPRFGEPNSSANLAYAPRTLQLGFRVAF